MRVIIAAIVLAICAPAGAGAEEISGAARVIDGDTIDVDGVRIRMSGIDAFETRQGAAGKISTAALGALIGGRNVRCQLDPDPDMFGRRLGECFAGGRSLNLAMVQDGQALAYWPPRDEALQRLPCPPGKEIHCQRTTARILAAEADARRSRRGIWRLAKFPRNPWCARHPEVDCVEAWRQ